MKTYGGADVEIHVFLISALVGGEWSASRPGRFTAGEKASRYHLDRRLGWPQNRSGQRGEDKNVVPIGTRTSTSGPSSP
jgi:hypothetical protein